MDTSLEGGMTDITYGVEDPKDVLISQDSPEQDEDDVEERAEVVNTAAGDVQETDELADARDSEALHEQYSEWGTGLFSDEEKNGKPVLAGDVVARAREYEKTDEQRTPPYIDEIAQKAREDQPVASAEEKVSAIDWMDEELTTYVAELLQNKAVGANELITEFGYDEQSIRDLEQTGKLDVKTIQDLVRKTITFDDFAQHLVKIRMGEVEQRLQSGDIPAGAMVRSEEDIVSAGIDTSTPPTMEQTLQNAFKLVSSDSQRLSDFFDVSHLIDIIFNSDKSYGSYGGGSYLEHGIDPTEKGTDKEKTMLSYLKEITSDKKKISTFTKRLLQDDVKAPLSKDEAISKLHHRIEETQSAEGDAKTEKINTLRRDFVIAFQSADADKFRGLTLESIVLSPEVLQRLFVSVRAEFDDSGEKPDQT